MIRTAGEDVTYHAQFYIPIFPHSVVTILIPMMIYVLFQGLGGPLIPTTYLSVSPVNLVATSYRVSHLLDSRDILQGWDCSLSPTLISGSSSFSYSTVGCRT